MGFFGKLFQGVQIGKKAAQAQQILAQHFGISPDRTALMEMCNGYQGLEGMGQFMNEYELAVYYAGSYHTYPNTRAGQEQLAKVLVVTQAIYQKGLAKSEVAREAVSDKVAEMNRALNI